MKYGFNQNYGMIKEKNPVAKTACGMVMGENRDGIAVFRGIPYAGNCDGKQRFLAPVPAEAWEGIRDCTKNGYIAPQFGGSISGSEEFGAYFSGQHPEHFHCEEEVQNENCLVLNVLTPGIDEKKRPVVVYIHGGGFSSGSGTLVLGADQWAREQDMVVVGINHRLNVFGYLYLGELDEKYKDSGAAGILDLILALRWVKENIEAFGGDAGNVTIMGESGGGGKISILLAMQEARGYFKKAIVESGSFTVGMRPKEEGTALAKAILKQLEIPEDKLELLQEKTTEEFLEAMKASGSTLLQSFIPVADGIHIIPTNGYAAPVHAADVPLLVGASEDEMAAFVDCRMMEDITLDNFGEYAEKLGEYTLQPLYDLDGKDKEAVMRRFLEWNFRGDEPGHVFINLASAVSVLAQGAYYQALAKSTQEAPVYYYMITRDVPHPTVPGKKYSWHTADLPLQMRVVLHPQCEALSRYMSGAWAAFVRNGNPSTEEKVWSPFTKEHPMAMVIAEEIYQTEDPLKKERELLEQMLGLVVQVEGGL